MPARGYVSGLVNQPILLGDTWLGLSHGKLFTIPRAEITFGAGLRSVLPTSTSSRNAGLITAASIGIFAERELGPLTAGYSVRPTKYFFTRSSPRITPLSETTVVNGQDVPIEGRPGSTGVANPDWAVVHGLNLGVELPRGFGLAASYLLYHVAPLRSGVCTVEGVPTANTCVDGPLVGPVNPSAMRTDQWFTFEADWKPKLLTIALGVSTYRPLMQAHQRQLGEDGCESPTSCLDPRRQVIAQPFLSSSADNYTTLYLSITASAEQLAQVFTEKP